MLLHGRDAVPAARERFLWLDSSAAGRGLLYLLLLARVGHACKLSWREFKLAPPRWDAIKFI